MSDFSKYSDEELMQIAGVKSQSSVTNMSDEELMRIAGVKKQKPTEIPNIFEGERMQPDVTAVNKPYSLAEELLSYMPGGKVPERPALDFFKPGLLPEGTTEKLDQLITGISPRTFGNYPVPENLPSQEKAYRTLHNLGAPGAKLAPELISSILEDPVGTIIEIAKCSPRAAQKIGEALGIDLLETLLKGVTGVPGLPFIPQQVTEEEKKQAQRDILEQPLDVVLGIGAPLLGLLKGKLKPKTKEVL